MKFVVSSSTLLKQLSAINGVVAANPVVPILENFLFEIEDGMLKATASDLQTSMTCEVPVEAKDSGSIAIPARILLDTLRNLPEQPVTFTIDDDTYSVELSSETGRYKLSGENATDFPKVASVRDGSLLEMPSKVLLRALLNSLFAASNDELRPAMTGVYLQLTDSSTTFVATDGHRLVRFRRVDMVGEERTSLILPKKAMTLLQRSLQGVEETSVALEFTPANAHFRFENITMICRLIDERFPDYENVIPKENPNVLRIDRMNLLGSLRRISIYANKTTHQIRLKLAGSQLQISAEDLDFSNEAVERLACEYNGKDLEIGFNGRFLMEILSTMTADEVELHLSEPNKAGIVVPVDQPAGEDVLMLVMPVMLSTYS